VALAKGRSRHAPRPRAVCGCSWSGRPSARTPSRFWTRQSCREHPADVPGRQTNADRLETLYEPLRCAA